jgi:hypothetical protein
MRLRETIVVDSEKTFGKLLFSAFHGESYAVDEDGKMIQGAVKNRAYDLISDVQGKIIRVKLPADVPERNFEYQEEVVLVDPKIDGYAIGQNRRMNIGWTVDATDIVLKKAGNSQQVKETGQKQDENKGNKEAAKQ